MSRKNQLGDSSRRATRQRNHPIDEDQDLIPNCRKRVKGHSLSEQNDYEKIPEIPVAKLTIEDMKSDPIALLAKLEQQYVEYGAVKLSCCQDWNPPFTFRYVDKGITTRIQKLQSLKDGKGFEQNIEAYNIRSFQSYAQNFQKSYEFRTEPIGSNLEGKRECEYWRLVTQPKYNKKQVEVEYAADLPSIRYGSGFPSTKIYNWPSKQFDYEDNLFNLNNIKNSENSLLKITSKRNEKISGITHTWVYMGMMFSTFCWHVQDLWVNSLNYNHKGGLKTWYIVPGGYKQKFDQYVKEKYCTNHFKKNLLQRITFMIDPLEIMKAGIPVYKTYQRPKQYVCTFFKAYHCGFSQGFNIGEAVNFLSPFSLPIMQQARIAKKKDDKPAPNVIPIEWLIIENYLAAEKGQSNKQIIKKMYTQMLAQEKKELETIQKLCQITAFQEIPQKQKYDKIKCSKCKEYLYLEAYKKDGNCYCYEHIHQILEKSRNDNEKAEITLLFRMGTSKRNQLVKKLAKKKIIDREQKKIAN